MASGVHKTFRLQPESGKGPFYKSEEKEEIFISISSRFLRDERSRSIKDERND